MWITYKKPSEHFENADFISISGSEGFFELKKFGCKLIIAQPTIKRNTFRVITPRYSVIFLL